MPRTADPHIVKEAAQSLDAVATSREFIAGDPLRGLAAVSIITSHCSFIALLITGVAASAGTVAAMSERVSYVYITSVLAPIALLIFFILSGYLIGKPFIETLLGKREFPPFPRYLRSRALRIVPALWALVIVTLLIFGTQGSSKLDIVAVLSGLQIYRPSAFAHLVPQLWSIDVEIAFYLLLPLVAASLLWIRRLPQGARAPVLAIALALTFLASMALHTAIPRGTFWLSPPWTAFVFVPGLTIALVEVLAWDRLARARDAGTWSRLPAAVGGTGVGLIVIYVLMQGPRDQPFDYIGGLPGIVASVGVGLAIGGVLLRQRLAGSCPRVLDNRVMQWIGVRSYSIYLLHALVVVGLGKVLPSSLGPWPTFAMLTIGTLAIAMPISALSYRFIESPFLRLKARTGATNRPQAG